MKGNFYFFLSIQVVFTFKAGKKTLEKYFFINIQKGYQNTQFHAVKKEEKICFTQKAVTKQILGP
jgi:hypothetical protein